MTRDSINNNLESEAEEILSQNITVKYQEKNSNNKKYIYQIDGLFIDIARNFISKEILKNLFSLANLLKVKSKIKNIFKNKFISTTESKKVSYLYNRNSGSTYKKSLSKLYKWHDFIKLKSWKGCTGKPFKHVLHIGIGGSILGCKAMSNALKDYSDNKLEIFYISSADLSEIKDTLLKCQLDQTLIIVSSKSFKTKETLLNFNYIKEKLSETYGKSNLIDNHFIAITSNKQNAVNNGISGRRIIKFPDTIPGRFSLTTSISFTLLLEIGINNYKKFLSGINQMDKHFKTMRVENNIPVLLALLSIWNINYLKINNTCITTYNYRLRSLFNFIQQLEMESNGKSYTMNNELIDYDTSPFLFGLQGTECQHSFFQMIHQGTLPVAMDFIGVINSVESDKSSKFLLSNLIAQADLCFDGKLNTENHKKIHGNHPCVIILLEKLSPKNLGLLVALYEHKVFIEGLLWEINSFDQWGVEEGKVASDSLLNHLVKKTTSSATPNLLKLINKKTKK